MCKLQIENVNDRFVGRRGLEEQLLERISALAVIVHATENILIITV